MNKYVSLDKRSKKAQREYHAKQRSARNSEMDLRPIFFLLNYLFLLDYDVT